MTVGERMPSGVRKTKILFVDLGASFGGAEVFLLRLLSSLQKDIDAEVLCCHPDLQGRLGDLGIRYTSVFAATGAMKVLQLVWASLVTVKILLTRGVDTLQINGYSEIVLIPIARLLGRRAVPTRHLGFDIEAKHWYQAPGRFIARWLYRSLAGTASSVVCVSGEVGREMETIAPGRVVVIPNWVDHIPGFEPKRTLQRVAPTLLFVGRMVPYKGMQLVLEAMRHPSMQGTAPTLLAVGDGPHRNELEHLAAVLDVQFLGFHGDVTPFYQQADLLLTPSLGPEGSSLVALEAMANGLPCLLSDLPVHREIARDGAVAGLFRTGDVDDLAQKMRQLLDDVALRKRYAAAAHGMIRQDHSGALATGAYLRVLTHG